MYIVFILSMLFGVAVAIGIWYWVGQSCTCYKAIALGLLGGIAGTIQGMIGAYLVTEEPVTQPLSILIVVFSSALFAAILQFRYADTE
jgi:hypothetical protein